MGLFWLYLEISAVNKLLPFPPAFFFFRAQLNWKKLRFCR